MKNEQNLPKTLTEREFQLVADHCYQLAQKMVRKRTSSFQPRRE